MFFEHPNGVFLKPQGGTLSQFSIFKLDDPERAEVLKKLHAQGLFDGDLEADRSMGILLGTHPSRLHVAPKHNLIFVGNVIGDALGAPLEFTPVEYNVKTIKQGFSEKDIWTRQR